MPGVCHAVPTRGAFPKFLVSLLLCCPGRGHFGVLCRQPWVVRCEHLVPCSSAAPSDLVGQAAIDAGDGKDAARPAHIDHLAEYMRTIILHHQFALGDDRKWSARITVGLPRGHDVLTWVRTAARCPLLRAEDCWACSPHGAR
jgi:hypothetical protein